MGIHVIFFCFLVPEGRCSIGNLRSWRRACCFRVVGFGSRRGWTIETRRNTPPLPWNTNRGGRVHHSPPPACLDYEAAVLGQVPPCAAVRWFRASGPRSSTPLSRAWSRAQRASRPPPEDRRAVARWVARQHASARRGAADLQPAGAARKAGRSRRCPARPTPPPVVCPGGSGRARTLAIESIALSSPPLSPPADRLRLFSTGRRGPSAASFRRDGGAC